MQLQEAVAGLLSSQAELEARLHELTESLIKKQTTLEALGSERNSLRLQLERTEVTSQTPSPTPGAIFSFLKFFLQSQLAAARKATPPSTHTAIKGLDTTTSESKFSLLAQVLLVTIFHHQITFDQ